ncbi:MULTISPECIES: CpaD family pilus assembly protein [Sphingomonas]|uniref:CpaD family pilus assembly protein n=1 Tax=Sphingomonas kyungheensis TaxID=1069987 RepID=A0ABU8H145_9SPHN|nr:MULTISPECIES: CpaD family pilus assembly protein [unclassified Sphingomonas]EZP57363.1 Pilus assembly protein CpaD [Sphingomonas sp. RIT328]
MTKRSLLLATLPALLLGGCMGTTNRGLESVHQPVVARNDYALDLATGGRGLAPGEGRRLAGWMDAMHLGFGDRVAIDEAAYAGAARDEVAAVVASYGLLLSDDRPVTDAPVTPGTVRVVISRMHASVPGCPDWSRNSSNEFDANTSSNYGCAVNTNLAAMIARPSDLVHGADPQTLADTTVNRKAIDAYIKKAPTGAGTLQATSTKGGN